MKTEYTDPPTWLTALIITTLFVTVIQMYTMPVTNSMLYSFLGYIIALVFWLYSFLYNRLRTSYTYLLGMGLMSFGVATNLNIIGWIFTLLFIINAVGFILTLPQKKEQGRGCSEAAL